MPGMNVDAVDGDDHLLGGERLVGELRDLGAVHGVGAQRPEAVDVEQRRPLADLLVGRERDPQRGPRELRMGGEKFDEFVNLGGIFGEDIERYFGAVVRLDRALEMLS